MNNYVQPNFLHSPQRVRSDNMGHYGPPAYRSGPRYPRYHEPWDGYVRNSRSSHRYGDAKTTNSAIAQSSSVTLSSMPQTSAAQSRMSQPSIVKSGQLQTSMVKLGQLQSPTVDPGLVVNPPVETQPSMAHYKNTQSSFTSLPHLRIEHITSAHPQTSTAQLRSQKHSETQFRQPPCSMELGQTTTLAPNRTQNSVPNSSVEQISSAQPRIMKAKLTEILTPQSGIKQSTMEQTEPRESTPYSTITLPTVPKITKTTHLNQLQSSPSKPIFDRTEHRRSPPKARHKMKESDTIQTSVAHLSNTQFLTSQAERRAAELVNVDRVSTTQQQVSVSQHGTSMAQPSIVKMKQISGVAMTCNTQPKISKTVMTQSSTGAQSSKFRPSVTKISITQSNIVQTSIPMVQTSPRITKTSMSEGKKEKSMTQQNSVTQPCVEQLTSKGEPVTKTEYTGAKPREGNSMYLFSFMNRE